MLAAASAVAVAGLRALVRWPAGDSVAGDSVAGASGVGTRALGAAFVCFRGDDRFFLPCLAWRAGR